MSFFELQGDGRADQQRLDALRALDILDTPPEAEFDDLVALAARMTGTSSAALSFVTRERQWFKARHGIPQTETPLYASICQHVVRSCQPLVVLDAKQDPRFDSNPAVQQENGVAFYAGMPITVPSGECVGTLCVFDSVPRRALTADHLDILGVLAQRATELIETRKFRQMSEIAGNAVEAISDAVLAVSPEGKIIYGNPAVATVFGYRIEQVLGRDIGIVMPARLKRRYRRIFARTVAKPRLERRDQPLELLAIRADGSEFPVECLLAPWGAEDGQRGFAAIIRDISARKKLERERERATTLFDAVIARLPSSLFVKDTETLRYLMVNRRWETLLLRRGQDVVGSTDRTVFPDQAELFEWRDRMAIESDQPFVTEGSFNRPDETTIRLRTVRIVIDAPDGGKYLLGISDDMTQVRQAEADVLRLAHFDPLTGLLNRASCTERLQELVRAGQPFAMLSIDLDRFKSVNDQFGHLQGDEVLVQVAERLRTALGPDDRISRIGGDEFVVIIAGEGLRERAQSAAEAIVVSLGRPFHIRHAMSHLGASIGVVLMPEDGSTVEQLRENADLALYRAKHNGRGTVCFFNLDIDAASRDRRKLESDLRQAVDDGVITLAYQPVVSARTERITSVEALARWVHPTRGPIPPDVFISLAEECGLIDLLGGQILRRACLDAQTLPDNIRVAVNLSPQQFASGGLLETVRAALAETGLAPDRLQVEITEGLLIRDVERTFAQLTQLRALGIQILIDDFGVGYSSLSYFHRFEFDKVKIDRSFVEAVATSYRAKAIIQTIVGLGERLGMGVVAEGVETPQQRRILTSCGCTHLQGYLFGRPVALDELRPLLTPSLAARRLSMA